MPGQNHAPSSGTGRAVDKSKVIDPVRSVSASSPVVGAIASRPSRRCEDPERPNKLAIGVILYACCTVISVEDERWRDRLFFAVVENEGVWKDSLRMSRWWIIL